MNSMSKDPNRLEDALKTALRREDAPKDSQLMFSNESPSEIPPPRREAGSAFSSRCRYAGQRLLRFPFL